MPGESPFDSILGNNVAFAIHTIWSDDCLRDRLGQTLGSAIREGRLLDPPMIAISQFERRVLERIALESKDPALQVQLAGVQIIERDYTGVGCYSKLLVPADAPLSNASYSMRGPLGGPGFDSPVVEYGGGTLLWFREGLADCLEIYVYGDYFPAEHSELGEFKLLD